MTALPGQRAAQRPLRALTAAQRVLGRAAHADDGGLVGPVGVAFVDGHQYQVDLSAPLGAQLSVLKPRRSAPGKSTGEEA